MHPSELKNRALTMAVSAELDGFPATAEAFRMLARASYEDAVRLRQATDFARHKSGRGNNQQDLGLRVFD